ncbi:hypothetical protein LZ30DRAFT_216450 [Colletotrichum cereale]|nr:hypothetical protein LZ30DRAFT_216450 [Colletotrichum cereale]
MAQSGYLDSAPMAEAQHMTLPFYATPPEQTPFLSHTNGNQLCQQWLGWDYQAFEPFFSPGNSAGSMSSVQWEAERQSQQSFEATRTTPNCPGAIWPPQPGDWSPYQQQQQYLQALQSAPLSPPPQWPVSTCNTPLTVGPDQQSPPSEGHNRPERERESEPDPEHRATATKKRTMKPARKPADPRLASMTQNRSKKARVGTGAGSEPPPASSISYEDNGVRAEDDNEGEDSDASSAPAGSGRKKTYRVKNRAAAKRCREKTKQYEIDLANREKQVTQERMYLDACVTALKNEVLGLKNQILQHGSCDCDMIQGYIARTASNVSVAAHGVPTMRRPSA